MLATSRFFLMVKRFLIKLKTFVMPPNRRFDMEFIAAM